MASIGFMGRIPARTIQAVGSCMTLMSTENFYIELTLYGELNNLLSNYERLTLQQSNPTHADVSRAYFGSQNLNRNMILKASTAVRISRRVIVCLKEITYQVDTSLCVKQHSNDGIFLLPYKDMHNTDCRLYHKFVNLTPFPPSTFLME